MSKDRRIGTVMETRGRFTKGEHSTHLEIVDGASVGYTVAHVVHCTCGTLSPTPMPHTEDAEALARRHVDQI